jgi:beta-mannanase
MQYFNNLSWRYCNKPWHSCKFARLIIKMELFKLKSYVCLHTIFISSLAMATTQKLSLAESTSALNPMASSEAPLGSSARLRYAQEFSDSMNSPSVALLAAQNQNAVESEMTKKTAEVAEYNTRESQKISEQNLNAHRKNAEQQGLIMLAKEAIEVAKASA